MTTTTTSERGGARVAVQRFGTFLSGMIMPNIPALIAWGIFTAFFIPVGWTPNAPLATIVEPMIHYLLPLLIANTAGRMVYDTRGGVVGVVATMGAIAGSDHLIAEFNETLPPGAEPLNPIHMFIGAMILGPLAAWTMKRLDALWAEHVRAGFEMLVNMFSAGIWGFIMAIVGFYPVAWLVNGIMTVLGNAVNWLVETNLLPLTSILIEPAKVFFLNNAINHGVLTPLGTAEAAETGKSILFLLEANPGPGLGILLAFTFFGVGMAKASAPGAAIIQFFGGIHEVYFPYVLMKPLLLIAAIAGGATGVATNMVFDAGLRAPASPGSIIAVLAQTASDSYLGVILSVVLSAAVSFAIAAVILRASRRRDLETENAGDLSDAIARTEANKGKSSTVLAGLAGSSAGGSPADAQAPAAAAGRAGAAPVPSGDAPSPGPVGSIIFACDAGMGSSAMGATVLRAKLKSAGVEGVTVSNSAISKLGPGAADIVITHADLTDRARAQIPEAEHVSVDNFMSSPRYEEVVERVRQSRAEAG
ncbi:PTS mannitol transporter subunit IICB [Leucobacter massiliensis]|uniref:PTS system mannitol-specific EIICB component n=1 Tax=Leucobacter massiliensis TaxID=1686285 RepID=A0A2S9QQF7_9MICO|nr:PTS mannitol transporter subunit IICB [Leucobacter massiliensis]PRI11815.1 PTS mannitol transporter subunit IIB [Leucobacter massiliensis]